MFCLWNPDSGIQNPGLWNLEHSSKSKSHEQLESKIQVPQTKNPESRTWNPESKAWNPESSTVLDSFMWGNTDINSVL